MRAPKDRYCRAMQRGIVRTAAMWDDAAELYVACIEDLFLAGTPCKVATREGSGRLTEQTA